ncbi:MAG: cytochrome c family protein [Betaproteobacteria bacterium]|nr:MAG: cytochrome c family protein [Betaproteobacteria bacterium]
MKRNVVDCHGLVMLTLLPIVFAGLSSVAQAQATVEPIEGRLASADVAAGKNVFLQCAACHVATPGNGATIGPNLWNVVGRPIAGEPGFEYSESLKQAGGNWEFERLNVYLFDPKLVAPEGRMPFPGIKSPNERAQLIAYLRTLSDNPVALPAAVSALADSGVADAGDDPEKWQGLPPGPGREDVFYRCKACHSLMIVKQQGLSRSAWDESLEWMVEEQGMTPIEDAAIRDRVLDYLSTHFGRK